MTSQMVNTWPFALLLSKWGHLKIRRKRKLVCHCMKTQAHVKLKSTKKMNFEMQESLQQCLYKNVILSHLALWGKTLRIKLAKKRKPSTKEWHRRTGAITVWGYCIVSYENLEYKASVCTPKTRLKIWKSALAVYTALWNTIQVPWAKTSTIFHPRPHHMLFLL